jgi:hypothetical protein
MEPRVFEYISSCLDSFDEDGDCIMAELPWSTVSDFACANELAKEIEAFPIPEVFFEDLHRTSFRYYVTEDHVYIAYDGRKDVHYFFLYH